VEPRLAKEEVHPDDLRRLDVIHQILRLLNEPRQSAGPIAELVEKLPVLEARVRRAYRPPQWYSEDAYGPASVRTILTVIGNRAFESVLLELLEDLTVLRASLDG
jgi:hypothetical protein